MNPQEIKHWRWECGRCGTKRDFHEVLPPYAPTGWRESTTYGHICGVCVARENIAGSPVSFPPEDPK